MESFVEGENAEKADKSIMQEISIIMMALICHEFGKELTDDIKQLITLERLPALFKLSKQHDLAHLVGDALDRNGLLLDGTEVKKRFLQERNLAVYRYEQIQYEFEQICDALEQAQIPFLPLKGSVIRPLYPEPWMRTSCDIDILVTPQNLDRAQATLEKKLDYTLAGKGDHDISLTSPGGVNLELHYQLLEDGAKDSEKIVLGNIWDVVEPAEGKNAHCKMPDEYFYCYHIAHITKHLRYGGCGVRSILDTWFLNHKIDFDKEKRDVLLQKAWSLSAAKAIENLAEVWFSGVEGDSLTESLGEYILTGGVYGTFDNKVAAQQTRKKGKFSYLFSRVFLPYSQMKFKYPRLQKCPILYPFYIVKRCFLLLNKEKRALALREVDQTINADEKQQKIAKLMKDLDL